MKNTLALFSFMLLMMGAPLVARDTAGTADGDEFEGIFIDTVDVNIVNIEVYVTDKKHNRIGNLTRDDFELLEDGKPVAITNFYAVEDGTVINGAEPLQMIDDIAEPEIVAGESRVPEDQRLSLVVYIDNYNLHPFSRNRAFTFIRSFLRDRVRIGDQVRLVTYDRSLHERHGFTGDPELIASSLYELEELSAHAIHRDSDRRDLLHAIYDAESVYDVSGRVRTYAENLFSDLSFTITALKDTVDGLAGLPGRKAILYVSDGLAMRSAEDLWHLLDQKFTEQHMLMESFRYDLTREYQKLTRVANSNRVSFYTIDAEGLRTFSYMDAQNQVAGGDAFIDQTHFSNLQAPLQMIAEETGGFAIINTNNFTKGLNRVGDDFGSYYSLAYSPASAGSGRYHNLEVRLKNKVKGVRIRHREGFRDKPIEDRMGDTTMAALFHGYERNGLGASLEVGRMIPRSDGFFDVPLIIKVPIGRLALLEREAHHRGRIQLFVAARDDEGGVSEVQKVPVPIDIPSQHWDHAQTQDYKYSLTMMMRSGSTKIAVTIRDEIGSSTAVVSTGVMVGERR